MSGDTGYTGDTIGTANPVSSRSGVSALSTEIQVMSDAERASPTDTDNKQSEVNTTVGRRIRNLISQTSTSLSQAFVDKMNGMFAVIDPIKAKLQGIARTVTGNHPTSSVTINAGIDNVIDYRAADDLFVQDSNNGGTVTRTNHVYTNLRNPQSHFAVVAIQTPDVSANTWLMRAQYEDSAGALHNFDVLRRNDAGQIEFNDHRKPIPATVDHDIEHRAYMTVPTGQDLELDSSVNLIRLNLPTISDTIRAGSNVEFHLAFDVNRPHGDTAFISRITIERPAATWNAAVGWTTEETIEVDGHSFELQYQVRTISNQRVIEFRINPTTPLGSYVIVLRTGAYYVNYIVHTNNAVAARDVWVDLQDSSTGADWVGSVLTYDLGIQFHPSNPTNDNGHIEVVPVAVLSNGTQVAFNDFAYTQNNPIRWDRIEFNSAVTGIEYRFFNNNFATNETHHDFRSLLADHFEDKWALGKAPLRSTGTETIVTGNLRVTKIIDGQIRFPGWKAGTRYEVGMPVDYLGDLYYCIVAHTASADFTDDSTNWSEINGGAGGAVDLATLRPILTNVIKSVPGGSDDYSNNIIPSRANLFDDGADTGTDYGTSTTTLNLFVSTSNTSITNPTKIGDFTLAQINALPGTYSGGDDVETTGANQNAIEIGTGGYYLIKGTNGNIWGYNTSGTSVYFVIRTPGMAMDELRKIPTADSTELTAAIADEDKIGYFDVTDDLWKLVTKANAGLGGAAATENLPTTVVNRANTAAVTVPASWVGNINNFTTGHPTGGVSNVSGYIVTINDSIGSNGDFITFRNSHQSFKFIRSGRTGQPVFGILADTGELILEKKNNRWEVFQQVLANAPTTLPFIASSVTNVTLTTSSFGQIVAVNSESANRTRTLPSNAWVGWWCIVMKDAGDNNRVRVQVPTSHNFVGRNGSPSNPDDYIINTGQDYIDLEYNGDAMLIIRANSLNTESAGWWQTFPLRFKAIEVPYRGSAGQVLTYVSTGTQATFQDLIDPTRTRRTRSISANSNMLLADVNTFLALNATNANLIYSALDTLGADGQRIIIGNAGTNSFDVRARNPADSAVLDEEVASRDRCIIQKFSGKWYHT